MTALTYQGRLVTTTCWCGIRVAIPEELYEYAQQGGNRSIYCPLGHTFVYRENEASRLRSELEAERKRTERERVRARAIADQRDAAERSARAYKGQATKLRKRAAAGVCPCCNRSFVQLERHMSRQHPDFVASAKAEV
jgi:hypothetical protein